MPKKLKDVITPARNAASHQNAPPMSDGKSYIKNPKNPNQILQVQSREGNQFKCFPVISKSGSVVTVDNKNAVYVSEDYESKMECL